MADPEAEFEYALAERLGRTRAELRATMSHREWIGWIARERVLATRKGGA